MAKLSRPDKTNSLVPPFSSGEEIKIGALVRIDTTSGILKQMTPDLSGDATGLLVEPAS
jgi:hypothetical protein